MTATSCDDLRLSERFGRLYTATTAQVALRLESASELDGLVEAHRLLRVETADGATLYPELQFDGDGSVVSALTGVLRLLLPAAVDGWPVLYWLTAPLDDFDGRTAAVVLRSGDPAEVTSVEALAAETANGWLLASE